MIAAFLYEKKEQKWYWIVFWGGRRHIMSQCDTCLYYCYDEEAEGYFCDIDVDEDEYARLAIGKKTKECPYYRSNDEYLTVRHQM